jgi:3-oxoacyl-[acyl-carrier-protein] synthase II
MTQRRVVVTGMGAITPIGATLTEFWDGLVSGQSGIRRIESFDTAPHDSKIAGECIGFDPKHFIDVRQLKRMDRFAQLAFGCGKMAFAHAGLEKGAFDSERAGVIIGAGIGGLAEIEDQHRRLIEKGPSKVSAFTIPKLMANAGSGHLSIEFGLQGISTTVVTACASAGNAMGDAYNAIRYGHAELILTGGSEAAVTPLGISAFAAMKALSTRNDNPAIASRPFDKDRDGFVLGEGAGMLVFEEYEHAKQRGATIYAEVIGFGATTDAGDMVQPDPLGRGAARAMQAALKSAQINPDEVDYINAHGTSTPLGDVAETKAIKRVFGDAAHSLAVSSTKSATGHLLGASGGVETIACALAIYNNVLPPTINHDEPDPECDLDYVPNHARDAKVGIALCNSFGFGGHNACLILKKLS